MSTTTIIVIISIAIIFAIIAVRGGGPRVTRIDRTVKRDKERDE